METTARPLRARSLLAHAGHSITSAADVLAMDRSHLTLVLNGRVPLTRRMVRQVSGLLGLPEADAFPEFDHSGSGSA